MHPPSRKINHDRRSGYSNNYAFRQQGGKIEDHFSMCQFRTMDAEITRWTRTCIKIDEISIRWSCTIETIVILLCEIRETSFTDPGPFPSKYFEPAMDRK